MKKNAAHISDEELALQAKTHIASFEVLIERYEQKLISYILRISHFSQQEAEEILQESFLKAWRNIHDFDISLKFSSWMYRITHNQTISEFRKQKSRGHTERSEANEEIFQNIADQINLPQELNAKLNAQKIQEVLQHLPEKYRVPLILKFLEAKSYEEISDILKIPVGTAGTLVNRAKQKMKEIFDKRKIRF